MAKADKATAVADIAEQFKDSTATLITEYRGLTVANLKDLRRSLGDSATYTVAKNTLVKRAAAEAGIDGLDELFVGPTAIAFVSGEAVDAAKALKTFAKDNKGVIAELDEVAKLNDALADERRKATTRLPALKSSQSQAEKALKDLAGSRSELNADNGYNTYRRSGLPEGPIANPGKASIAAVLHPAQTKALYFVADGSGGHAFAETLAEQNANVAKWYAIRRQRGQM